MTSSDENTDLPVPLSQSLDETLAYLFHKVNHSIAKFRISQKQQLNYEEADLSLISFKVSKNLHTKHSLFFSQHDKSSQSLNNFQQLLDALLICLHKNHTTTWYSAELYIHAMAESQSPSDHMLLEQGLRRK